MPSTLVQRVEASTPANRDRAADALRAIAITGVVLGHWLITAFVHSRGGGMGVRSPLAEMPAFTPLSWVLQTLAVFFLVGGYSGALSLGSTTKTYGAWVRARMARLFRPVLVFLGVWAVAGTTLVWAGALDLGTLRTVIKLVVSPLWFLLVYAALTATTPLVVRLWRRARWAGFAGLVAAVAAVDLGRFALGGPTWLGWTNVLVGWLVPYYLGVAWAHGAFTGRRLAAGLFAGGALGTVALVLWAGYPASMVGVPRAAISNLNPPTLAAVAFGTAQVGLAMLVRDRLACLMRRPALWTAVALANLSAMTVFLWHQTAMMTTTLTARAAGTVPGLHTIPDHSLWIMERLAWLPVFGMVLAGLWALFHRFERPRGRRPRPRADDSVHSLGTTRSQARVGARI
ncbi:acyltransferase family protein [Yinghuangia seranimata]|uniref:acyltransferase family protein n=1 Tax=Yinghuangia seranimata TaxID=408067 RepID=UPI00248C4264|nr:acyltransferase [Yinghuangia seranimata]MDI2131986.1 acyltransferase [Yinghuangia seranimata]